MSTLARHTSPELIIPQLRSRTAAGVIGELCATLERGGRVKDPLSFYNAVMSHEALSSTATSPGWALPHARVQGLERLSFALGRCRAPLVWPQPGGEPVQLIFLFAVPESEGASYLALISGLAKFSQDPVRVERLLRAPDHQAILEVLKQVRLPQPQPAAIQN